MNERMYGDVNPEAMKQQKPQILGWTGRARGLQEILSYPIRGRNMRLEHFPKW